MISKPVLMTAEDWEYRLIDSFLLMAILWSFLKTENFSPHSLRCGTN